MKVLKVVGVVLACVASFILGSLVGSEISKVFEDDYINC